MVVAYFEELLWQKLRMNFDWSSVNNIKIWYSSMPLVFTVLKAFKWYQNAPGIYGFKMETTGRTKDAWKQTWKSNKCSKMEPGSHGKAKTRGKLNKFPLKNHWEPLERVKSPLNRFRVTITSKWHWKTREGQNSSHISFKKLALSQNWLKSALGSIKRLKIAWKYTWEHCKVKNCPLRAVKKQETHEKSEKAKALKRHQNVPGIHSFSRKKSVFLSRLYDNQLSLKGNALDDCEQNFIPSNLPFKITFTNPLSSHFTKHQNSLMRLHSISKVFPSGCRGRRLKFSLLLCFGYMFQLMRSMGFTKQ